MSKGPSEIELERTIQHGEKALAAVTKQKEQCKEVLAKLEMLEEITSSMLQDVKNRKAEITGKVLKSEVTGEKIDATTGEKIEDDGKVTDINGWKKDNLH